MTGVGLVGAGKWGGNWLRTLAALPETALRWCCDLNENLLASVHKQFPQLQTTTSFDDLIRDPAFSTSVGMLQWGSDQLPAGGHNRVSSAGRSLGEILRSWFRRFVP